VLVGFTADGGPVRWGASLLVVLGFLCGGETWTRVAPPVPSNPANSMAKSTTSMAKSTKPPVQPKAGSPSNTASKAGQKQPAQAQPTDPIGDICLLPDIARLPQVIPTVERKWRFPRLHRRFRSASRLPQAKPVPRPTAPPVAAPAPTQTPQKHCRRPRLTGSHYGSRDLPVIGALDAL
jgi:hypothetical protein